MGTTQTVGLVSSQTAALETAQDRLDEKRFLTGLGIPTAPFEAVDSLAHQTFRFTVPAEPTAVRLDPRHDLFFTLIP